MALESGEFHDWELLHDSSESNSLKSSDSVTNLAAFDPEPHATIQPDYFSLNNYLTAAGGGGGGGGSDQGSVYSDNPSWVDPESEPRFVERERGENWPDSGTDRSEDRSFDETEAKSEVGFDGFGEIEARSQVGFVGNEKSFVGIEGIEENGSKGEVGFVGNEKSFVGIEGNSEIGQNATVGEEISAGENDDFGSKNMEVAKAGGEGGKRSVVWWKVPLELLKFCAFRASPVWSFSMAAAVMGVVILTRRLYKLKRKSQALKFKVTMDDKKVSQFMSRAARINEAFLVVKRVPLIRPAMPTTGGLTQWPVMSLR